MDVTDDSMYSVVVLKNNAAQEESVVESTAAETPANAIYAVVDKKKKKRKTENASGSLEEIALESSVKTPNKGENPAHSVTNLHFKTNTESDTGTFQKRMFICLLATVIVMAVIMSMCFIAAFVEISKVKSATDSYSQQVSMENTVTAEITYQQLLQQLVSTIIQQYESAVGLSFTNPASSCASVLLAPSSPSGYYWIRSSNGSAVNAYCHRSCGDIAGGWMRVAELDMTDNSSQCPSGLGLNDSNIRTCVGTIKSASCSSVIFPTAVQYSVVCGKIIAYQVGTTNAFETGTRNDGHPHIRNNFSTVSIDTYYVDGVSLTHGNSPRHHIWTFAAALNELDDQSSTSKCPHCSFISYNQPAPHIPTFVGADYFCDIGSRSDSSPGLFHSDDPLWDGAGCGGNNTCCSFNNPPWFYKQLPRPTTDDIEMRVCRDENVDNEDIAIEKIKIYVK